MRNFALIGAAGFIAPRHMAGKYERPEIACGGPRSSDSVGVMDTYFPKARSLRSSSASIDTSTSFGGKATAKSICSRFAHQTIFMTRTSVSRFVRCRRDLR
jgi:hypothetical protein